MSEVSPLLQRVLSASERGRPGLIMRLIRRRCLGCRHVPEVRSWTKEEIVAALVKAADGSKTLSKRRLQLLHDDQPRVFPSPMTLEATLGPAGWREASAAAGLYVPRPERVKKCFGMLGSPPNHDVFYFLELFKSMGLRTKKLYLEARRRYPEVVPPYVSLLRTVGGMSTLEYLVRLESCEDQLKTLVTLMNELGGRWPRKDLCRQREINRRALERKFGGRAELEELCRELLPHYRDTQKKETGERRS